MDINEYADHWLEGQEASAQDWFETLHYGEDNADLRVSQDMWKWWLTLNASDS